MGCTSSVFYTKKSCKQFSRKPSCQVKPRITITYNYSLDLSADEINIVRKTWHILERDLSGNGLRVFLKIFDMCPEIKELFSVEDVPNTEIVHNVLIKAHGVRFMAAVLAAVDSLDDFDKKVNNLYTQLFVLGQQHIRYDGFKPEYFEIYYEALMWQWERCLGDAFTPEVSDTWSHLFVYIMETLKKGYYTPEVTPDLQTYIKSRS